MLNWERLGKPTAQSRAGQGLLKLVEVIHVFTGGLTARMGGEDPARAA